MKPSYTIRALDGHVREPQRVYTAPEAKLGEQVAQLTSRLLG